MFVFVLLVLTNAKVFWINARSKVDISISGQPTTEGVDFTYEISNPDIGGSIYWMLTDPQASSATLTADDIRGGQGALHPGCGGNGKQVDEAVHEVYLRCALVEGQRYKIWIVKDNDGMGRNQHIVTPDGVPVIVPLPDPAVTLQVKQNTVRRSGFTYTYKIDNYVPDGKFYWMLTEANAGNKLARAVMQGGECSGNGPQQDNNVHELQVRCNMKPGVTYNLWFAVDFNGQGQGVFLSPKSPSRVQIPFSTKLTYSVDNVSLQDFNLNYKLANFASGGKVYYLLVPQGQQVTSRQVFTGTGGITKGSFYQTDDNKHIELVSDRFQPGVTYTLYMAYDTDGRGANLQLATPPAPVKIPNNTQVTISVLQEKTSIHGYTFTYRFKNITPGGKMYCTLTDAGISHYTGEDVRDGKEALWSDSFPQLDENMHTVGPVNVNLKQATTYLLWCAIDQDGTGRYMELHKTNVVLVPAIDCGSTVTSLPRHARANCMGNTRFQGDPCMATCDEGFTGGPARYTCTESGRWTGSVTCSAIDCGGISSTQLVNARSRSCTNTLYGGPGCQVECVEGYTGQTTKFMCGIDGKWSGSIRCTSVSCGSMITGLSERATARCSDTNYGGKPCVAKCKTGYKGPDSPYKCLASGQWTPVGSAIMCQAVDCGSVNSVVDKNAEVSMVTGTTFQSTAKAACRLGYTGGSTTYTCDASGKWKGSLTCTALDCGVNIKNLDSNAKANCKGNTKFGGDMCIASCNDGYTGGNAQYQCTEDGVWAGALLCTRKDCGRARPSSVDPLAKVDMGATLFGDTATATCPPGYDGGPTQLKCTANGWAGALKCSPKNCGPLPVQPNAEGTCTDTHFGGDRCMLKCKSGYKGTPGHFTCGTDGKWSGSVRCTAIDCGSPKNVLDPNAVVDMSNSVSTNYRSVITARCANGYEGGSAQYTCGDDGHWHGSLTCKEPCPEKATSISVSIQPMDCAFGFTYELSNHQNGGKVYYAVQTGRDLNPQDVVSGSSAACHGDFDQYDDLRHYALIKCNTNPGTTYTLYVAVDSDGNGSNLKLTQKLPLVRADMDSVSVGVSDVTEDSLTLNYEYSSSSFPNGGSRGNGKLFYALTTTDTLGFNAPADIRTGRSTLVFGQQPKTDSRPHSVNVNVPITAGRSYYLWVATDSSSDGSGISLVTPRPVVVKVPDATIARVRVDRSDNSGVSFSYQLSSYVPFTGKLFYAISRDGVVLNAADVEAGRHTMCYGDFEEGSTVSHSARVDCDLTQGSYVLWVGTDECGGGCGVTLSTPSGVRFSVGSSGSSSGSGMSGGTSSGTGSSSSSSYGGGYSNMNGGSNGGSSSYSYNSGNSGSSSGSFGGQSSGSGGMFPHIGGNHMLSSVHVNLDQSSATDEGVRFSYKLQSGPTGGKIYWSVNSNNKEPTLQAVRLGTSGVCGGYHQITDNTVHQQQVFCDLSPSTSYTLWVASDTNGQGTNLHLMTPNGENFRASPLLRKSAMTMPSSPSDTSDKTWLVIGGVFTIVILSLLLVLSFSACRREKGGLDSFDITLQESKAMKNAKEELLL